MYGRILTMLMLVATLLAAREAGVDLSLADFDRQSARTPTLCTLNPGGPHFMVDFARAGGVSAVLS